MWTHLVFLGLSVVAPMTTAVQAGQSDAATARGTLTVNGRSTQLAYAYAALEPNTFDATRDDIVVVLTDKPIPAGILAAHTLGGLNSAATAAGIENYLRIELWEADEQEKQTSRAILGAWVIGHRTIGHAALDGRNLQASPDPSARMESPVVTRERVSGRVHSDGPQTFPHDHEHVFDVTFDVPVAPRRPAAPPPPVEPSPAPNIDGSRAKPLPPGGGDPGRAYLAYNKALLTADFAALERLDFSLSKVSDKEKALVRDLLPGMKMFVPADVTILAGRSDGGAAVLDLEATVEGVRKKGGAEVALIGGSWMVLRDWWK